MNKQTTDNLINSLQSIVNQNSCHQTKLKLGGILQYIIYFFNKNNVRDTIISDKITELDLQNKIHYMGSISFCEDNNSIVLCEPYDYKNLKTYFNKEKDYFDNLDWFKLIEDNKHKILEKPITIFTVCLHYNKQSVHYVSFIYIKNKGITSFDPGHEIYKEGNNILKPAVFKSFSKLLPKKHKVVQQLGKQCSKFRYIVKDEPSGIQWNGKNRDAFCQTWTIYFLVDFLEKYTQPTQKYKLIGELCQTLPNNREVKLFADFIIPVMIKYSKKNWLNEILNNYYEYEMEDSKRLTKTEFLVLLKNYSSICRLKVCKAGSTKNSCIVNTIKLS